MEQFEMKGKKSSVRKFLAALLCVCMLLTSADITALAAGVNDGVENAIGSSENSVASYMTPDEEAPFGAYALSKTDFVKRAGKSVEMKVYAWSTRAAVTYTWYHAAGYELEETGDTLKIQNLTDGEDSDFGTYRCVVSDGTEKKTIKFWVTLDSTLAVETDSPFYKECYIGEPVNLSVEAKDYGEPEKGVTYQWYRGKKLLEGETGAELKIPHQGTQGKNKKYKCVVSNGATSVTKEFTICTKYNNISGYIVSEEGRKTSSNPYYYYLKGTEHTWQVEVQGNPYAQYTYQWYERDTTSSTKTAIEGETEKEFSFTVGDTYGREYTCEVSDGTQVWTVWGCAYPLSQEVSGGSNWIYAKKRGENAKLSVYLSVIEGFDKEQLSYQWYRRSTVEGEEDKLLEGETSEVLSFEKVTDEDYGQYYCRVSWGEEKYLDANGALEKYLYHIQQSSYYAYPGMTVTFTAGSNIVRDTEPGTMSYQWYENGNKIEGATEKTYTKEVTEENKYSSYYCEISGDNGTYKTNSSYLNIIEAEGTDWKAGNNSSSEYYNLKVGEKVVLNPGIVRQESAPELSVTWEKEIYDNYDGVWTRKWFPMEKEGNTCELSYDELDTDNRNTEYYRVTITDGIRTETINYYVSREQTLAVELLKDNQYQYDGGYYYNTYKAEEGETVSIQVKAESTMPEYIMPDGISYQWMKWQVNESDNWEYVEIPGATEAVYEISSVQQSDYGNYQCVVSDGNETIRLGANLYNYYLNAQQEENTSSITVYPGEQNVKLKVKASYENPEIPITYQWMRWGYNEEEYTYQDMPIVGETQDTLVIDRIDKDTVGEYWCRVTAGKKSTAVYYYLSWTNLLRFNGRKGTDYYSAYAEQGDIVPFTVAVNALDSEISYQWLRSVDGEECPIEGATTGIYRVAIEDKTDFGSYTCKVVVNGVELEFRAVVYNSAASGLKVMAGNGYSSTKNISCEPGTSVQLQAVAYCGEHELQYQWEKADEQIEGAVSAEYSLLLEEQEDYGQYYCRVSCPVDGFVGYVQYNITNPSAAEPTEPEQPAEPEKPTEPETPVQPAEPEQPVEPETPVQPTEPEQPVVPETVAVSGITLNKNTLELAKGQQETLTASVAPENAANKAVSWSSSNPKTVSVENGVVTAQEKGTATITATTADGGKTAECVVKVVIPVQKVILPETKYMVKGDKVQLKATLTPADTTDEITWKSSDKKVVTVSKNGKVTAQGAGTAKITATASNGKRAVCKITVLKKKVLAVRVKLNKEKETLKVGKTIQLKATLNPTKCTEELVWKSSNRKVASVDKNGVVTAKKPGKTTITVKTEETEKTAKCVIEVKQPAISVEVKKSATIKVGKELKLKAKMTPADSTDKLKWSTSNAKIATVSSDGVVKGIRKGKVTITVRTSGGKTAKCKITVK